MNPIINPWLVYLIENTDHFRNLFNGLGIGFLCIAMCLLCGVGIGSMEIGFTEKIKQITIIAALLICITPILFTIKAVIPDKSTCYKILAASFITPDNVTKSVEIGKKLKDEIKNDVIDVIKSFNVEEKK